MKNQLFAGPNARFVRLRTHLLFVFGLAVTTVAVVAWERQNPKSDPTNARMAEHYGIPSDEMNEIMTSLNELSIRRTLSREKWRRLEDLSRDSNAETRYEAFNAMGHAYGTPYISEAISEVSRMPRDPSPTVRANYFWLLFLLRSKDADLAAARGLNDPNQHVRDSAKLAIDSAKGLPGNKG